MAACVGEGRIWKDKQGTYARQMKHAFQLSLKVCGPWFRECTMNQLMGKLGLVTAQSILK
jgi:hypothetical protein